MFEAFLSYKPPNKSNYSYIYYTNVHEFSNKLLDVWGEKFIIDRYYPVSPLFLL